MGTTRRESRPVEAAISYPSVMTQYPPITSNQFLLAFFLSNFAI